MDIAHLHTRETTRDAHSTLSSKRRWPRGSCHDARVTRGLQYHRTDLVLGTFEFDPSSTRPCNRAPTDEDFFWISKWHNRRHDAHVRSLVSFRLLQCLYGNSLADSCRLFQRSLARSLNALRQNELRALWLQGPRCLSQRWRTAVLLLPIAPPKDVAPSCCDGRDR